MPPGTETARLSDQLERTWKGDAWHGPTLSELTSGLTATQAATPHLEDAHSIWEIVLHLTGWMREVDRRMAGGEPGEPQGGDWPDIGAVTEERWQAARDDLGRTVGALASRIRAFSDERLGERVGKQRDPAMGTGQTYYVMLHGVVQHNLYHGGQIALLKKLA